MKTNLITLILLAFAGIAFAQTPEDQGLEIAIKADEVDQGFGSSTTALTMILTNKQGQESTRFMENRTLEQEAANWSLETVSPCTTPWCDNCDREVGRRLPWVGLRWFPNRTNWARKSRWQSPPIPSWPRVYRAMAHGVRR